MNYQQLWRRLARVYEEGEAKAMARMVYEVRYGLSMGDLLMGRDAEVPADEIEQIVQRLEHHEPVQYVLGLTDFCGRSFLVNSHVLIPRPETAELCRWITASIQDRPCTLLDVGTGSGCIAVTLAAELPQVAVTAWDISADALHTAQENATRNSVSITFQQVDMLSSPQNRPDLCHGPWTCIVSNPPYIAQQERTDMEANVLDYEPHTALFVPDNDPLVFYRAIAHYGQSTLEAGGWLFFEINPRYASDLQELLTAQGYHDITCRCDDYGKQRMIKARR